MKIERLLGILFYIINRDNVSANTLAEHFNVSRRTIIRDINTLTLAGIPIYSEIGSKGGYSINRNYKLNEKIIDNTNSEYILLALQSLKSVYGEKKVHETYEKVKHIYSDKNNNNSLNIDFSIVNENKSIISYISMLKEAIQNNKTILFEYTNLNSDTRIVKCNIVHVFYKWYSWYAFGYDLEKSNFRMFKIVRMKNLEISDEYFDNNYNVEKLLDEYEEKRDNDNIYITIEYSKEIETLINEYFHGDIINISESSIVKKVAIKENDFIMFSIILGFGEKIKVLSPLSYQEKIREHLKKTLIKNYSNSDI
ncbi:helix-turn-helix transcriptional regulator [Tepidibacter hydrothermalis]|uniref:WYL domain-containing protein n=1 Tax=Tepidibacter hydrothermalis TaxID=3036126 RepID=A0ABY8ED91_9FIRM|nr:WYL domain-containing protein [Tepidibacter hydrothermalis]WFD10908.1 WYL domain-containing protein [Tepidibacter hydrothermalis]